MRKFYFLIFVAICASAFAQAVFAENLGKPVFEDKIYFTPQSDSLTVIEVYLSIYNTGLQFIRQRPYYKAEFDLLIALYRGDELIAKVGRRDSSVVEKYSQTSSREGFAAVWAVLEGISPEDYRLYIAVTDVESKERFIKEAKIKVPRFSLGQAVALGGIILYDDRWRHLENSAYFPLGDSIRFESSVSVMTKSDVELIYSLLDGDSILASDTTSASEGYSRLRASLPLPEGAGELELRLSAVDSGRIAAQASRRVALSGRSQARMRFDPEEAVEQLSLIESGSELKILRNALKNSPESIDSLIEVFWSEKDPTPNTEFNELREEFYRRIALANLRFRSSRAGWRTDRGKVLIVYGEPDEIENHPFEMGFLAYEIWYYFNPRRTFYFEDRHSTGDYDLVRQE